MSTDLSESDDDFEDSMTDSPSPVDEPKDLSKCQIPKMQQSLLPKMFPSIDMLTATLMLNPAMIQFQQQLFDMLRTQEPAAPEVEVDSEVKREKRSKLCIEEILNIKSEVSPSQCSPCSNESLSPKREIKEEVKEEEEEAGEDCEKSSSPLNLVPAVKKLEDTTNSSPKSTTSQSE